MEESEHSSSGVLSSLGRVADTLLSVARNRVELFALEWEQETEALVGLFIWVALAVFSVLAALVVVTLTVVFLCPEHLRAAVLIGFSVFYVAAAAGVLLGVRRRLKQRPKPFSDTVAELRKDVAWLRTRQ